MGPCAFGQSRINDRTIYLFLTEYIIISIARSKKNILWDNESIGGPLPPRGRGIILGVDLRWGGVPPPGGEG
jgi:hypothetical protein